jgi:hypothetical protein
MAETREKKAASIAEIRRAVADYMNSEGCSCCRAQERHDENKERLGKMLKVPKYSDGSGRDFDRFRTKE